MGALNFQPRVAVFDANIGVGHRHDRPAPFDDPAGLLDEMKRHRVGRAVIYHVQGESISAIQGNEELTKWADAEGPFSLQWTAGPNADSLRQLQEFHAAGKVQSVRLHNTESVNIPFADWIYGELLEWLNAERLPLWVSLADTPPTEIMSTLKLFPDLVTVLLGAHYRHAILVHPLLKGLPNAHLELSRYEVPGGIEALKAEFGVERLIYGSFYPRYAIGPMLYYLHHTRLSDPELAAVCAGNLKRILGEEGQDD